MILIGIALYCLFVLPMAVFCGRFAEVGHGPKRIGKERTPDLLGSEGLQGASRHRTDFDLRVLSQVIGQASGGVVEEVTETSSGSTHSVMGVVGCTKAGAREPSGTQKD